MAGAPPLPPQGFDCTGAASRGHPGEIPPRKPCTGKAACQFPSSPRVVNPDPFMRIPILMPQLGESIAEATLLRLDLAPGDLVQADQEIM